MKQPLTKREKILIFILLTIIVSPLLVIFPLYIAFSEKRFKRNWKKFLNDFNNKNILVCTREHGWENYLQNDLFPLLTTDTIVVWNKDVTNRKIFELAHHYTASQKQSLPRPYVLIIRDREVVRYSSLNELLSPFKMPGKRSAATQLETKALLQEHWPEISVR